jgi:SAM-dependent methyltransferase
MTDTTDRTPDAAAWDERYGAADQVWSGEPNGALVAEIADLTPVPTARRALDVGCGEGADAVWLARRGWQVTALDVSRVALDRAERHARDAGVEVTWVHAGLVEADLPARTFDLVSAQYPVLLRTPGARAERTLADLVAPGGTLLVVHHDLGAGHDHHDDAHHDAAHHDAAHHDAADHGDADHDDVVHVHEPRADGGFDPELYALPADVAAVLGDGWVVEVDERRPRSITGGGGAHHVRDLVLRARRR